MQLQQAAVKNNDNIFCHNCKRESKNCQTNFNTKKTNLKNASTKKQKRQLFKLHLKKQNPNLSWTKNATFLQFMKQSQN